MKVRVSQWGNSLGIRIPSSIAALLKVEEGRCLDVEVADGRLVLTPVREQLEDLLSGVTIANLHEELDWGEAEERESW